MSFNELQQRLTIKKQPISYVFKWMANSLYKRKVSSLVVERVDINTLLDDDFIIWLGHASFYMQIDGVKILTDPLFFDLPFAKRLIDLPISLEEIKPDVILISHNHRDHCDIKSLKALKLKNKTVKIITPNGVGDILRDLGLKISELGWDESANLNGVSFTLVASAHWSARGIFDFNKALWGSFVIKGNTRKIFFAGDSAFNTHFKDIYNKYGEMDFSLLPIGAYSPTKIMKGSHMNPSEAFDSSLILGGVMIPYHYGTYDLSDEPINEPIELLREIQKERTGRVYEMNAGEILKF